MPLVNDQELVEKYIEISTRYIEDISANDTSLHAQNNGGTSIQVFQSTGSNPANIYNHSVVTVVSYTKSKVILLGKKPLFMSQLLTHFPQMLQCYQSCCYKEVHDGFP